MQRSLLLLLVLVCSCAPAPPAPPRAVATPTPRTGAIRPLAPEPESVKTLAEITLGAVGDVLMHGAVKRCAAAHALPSGAPGAPDGNHEGYSWLYAAVADLLAAPDLTFANLETPIAPSATDHGVRQFVFNAPVAAARALGAAGVDLVSVANNHAFDQGYAGFVETLERLDEIPLAYVGAGTAPHEDGPRHFEVKGLRLAVLGYAQFFNREGNVCPPAVGVREPAAAAARAPGAPKPCRLAAVLERGRALAAVTAAAKSADAVVISVHWGVEYAATPRAEEIELAHALADAGALVVLGHHPHVLQPLELYRRADGGISLIAYSLGNFISNQSRKLAPGVAGSGKPETRDGALLHARLARRDYGRGVIRTELTGAGYVPLWTENDTVELDLKRDPDATANIQVVALERRLAEVRAEIEAVSTPVPAALEARFVELRRREELYRARRAAIAAVLGEDFEMWWGSSR